MLFQKIRQVGELVKFSHSIFALPFALSAMVVAAHGFPPLKTIVLIILAMVTLRNAAMAFNRYIDAEIDAKNPRTATRHIPKGILSRSFVLSFSLINAGAFLFIAHQLNHLCSLLSFAALLVAFFYSFTKRFTDGSHLILGFVLGISPIGAWIAVQGNLPMSVLLLGLAVTLWVAGFDIIYATQDYEFDAKEKLHSLVVKLGIRKALITSKIFHGLTFGLLLLFGFFSHLGYIYYGTVVLVGLLLGYEHALISPQDLSRINAAFFNINGAISLLFFVGTLLAVC